MILYSTCKYHFCACVGIARKKQTKKCINFAKSYCITVTVILYSHQLNIFFACVCWDRAKKTYCITVTIILYSHQLNVFFACVCASKSVGIIFFCVSRKTHTHLVCKCGVFFNGRDKVFFIIRYEKFSIAVNCLSVFVFVFVRGCCVHPLNFTCVCVSYIVSTIKHSQAARGAGFVCIQNTGCTYLLFCSVNDGHYYFKLTYDKIKFGV